MFDSSVVQAREPEPAFDAPGYVIHRELGRGGFGVVYAALRESDGLPVALKVALPEQADAAAQLASEADALEAIGIPHVPAVYARGVAAVRPYLVLEWITAPTLADRLAEARGPLSREQFSRFASDILRAVAGIHTQGFTHFDLKPENIFLPDSGGARIIDFGLAKTQRAIAERDYRPSMIVGTAEYMSPEQCDGVRDADVRSDIYSLGVVFYEMLSGSPPFWGKAADVREAQRSLRPVPLVQKVDTAKKVSEVITRCLSKDRAARFETVAALQVALEHALASHADSIKLPLRAEPARAGAKLSTPAAARALPREKRTVGLVYFESKNGIAAVQHAIIYSGGQIVQTTGSQFIAAFGHEVGDNPARIALLAAEHLISTKLAMRCLVDVAAVSVQLRPDGSRCMFSPLFSRQDRFPTSNSPVGLVLSLAVTEIMADLAVSPVPGTPDRFTTDLTFSTSASTPLGAQLTPLVGRDETLSQLRESASLALHNAEPTLVSVIGEAGYGRTHLASCVAHELGTLLVSAEIIRLTARENLIGGLSPLIPELLRRLLRLPTDAPSDGGRAVLNERYGEAGGGQLWVGAAVALGWVEASHSEVRRLTVAPSALRLAMARAAGEALRRRAHHRPVVLILDDAHLADDAMLDALEYATLKEGGARVWACVLARPSFTATRPSWATRAARRSEIHLPALATSDAIALMRHLLLPVEHVPLLALSRLADRARGIPRLLMELVRGLKREGLIRRSARGTGHYLATDELDKLPDLPILQWSASREVEALPPQLARCARMCAVLGSRFSVAEVEGLLENLEPGALSDNVLLDASVGLQRLVDANILIRHRDGCFDFRHALLRDTLYEWLPAPQREALHRAAFELYQGLEMAGEHRLPRYALHAARSGAKEAAATAYLELSQRRMDTQSYIEAEAAFGSALENLSVIDDERAIVAARGRGLMRFRLGRHEDALKDLQSARELARHLTLPEREAALLLDEAMVLDWTRELALSAERVLAAISIAPKRDGLLSVQLAVGMARIEHRRGAAEACVRLGAEAAARALDYGEAGYEARIVALSMIATDCANLGRFEEAERYFDAMITETAAHSDLLHLGAAHLNRMFLWFATKETGKLFADCAHAIRIAREIGEPRLEYLATSNLGEVSYTLAELDEATGHTLRAIELAKQLWGDACLEVGDRELLRARIALYREDLEEARKLAGAIRDRLGASETPTVGGLAESDQMLLQMVEYGARNASEAEWEELTQRSHALNLQPLEEVELIESRALSAFRAGLVAESRVLLKHALEVSAAKPNLLGTRVARKFERLFGGNQETPTVETS